MAKEWIDQLAQQIKERNHEAAEEYGRSQHYAGIIAAQANGYFIALTQALQEDVDALRTRLQGDLTAAETAMATIKADELRITRARFPWVDARVIHRGETITLDYAKTQGVTGDPSADRKSIVFSFRVDPDDTMYAEEAFAERPGRYQRPEELAQRIIEILFTPTNGAEKPPSAG